MAKTCASEGCGNPIFSHLYCLYHQKYRTDPKWLKSLEKSANKGIKSKSDTNIPNNKESVSNAPIQKFKSNYKRKPTGEYKLFLEIYAERKGICQITGKQLQFDIWSFLHILSKGAYSSLRLCEENILLVDRDIHDLYDHSSKEKLLEKYPAAIMIYELKDKLRYKYYNS